MSSNFTNMVYSQKKKSMAMTKCKYKISVAPYEIAEELSSTNQQFHGCYWWYNNDNSDVAGAS